MNTKQYPKKKVPFFIEGLPGSQSSLPVHVATVTLYAFPKGSKHQYSRYLQKGSTLY